ncbi:MAG: PilN domain-containing protein [Psychromonas sp.]
MSNINLLPWRENNQKKSRRVFFALFFIISLVVIGISYLGKMYINAMISVQNQRNQYLQTQMIILDRRLADIHHIKKEKALLEGRIHLIQKLEEKRNDATHLFNTLAQEVPTGVYLKMVTFNQGKIVVQGSAESANRLTSMMRNMDSSGWLGDADLRNIKEGSRKPMTLYDFVLEFRVVPEVKKTKS